MKKLNQKLFILLVLQLLILSWVWWPRASQTHTPRSLFGNFKWENLQKITIQDDKAQVALKKEEAKWVVADLFDYPADEKKIAEFFKKLEGIKPSIAVGQTASSYRRLEVGDEKFQRKISFETNEQKKTTGLYLGTAPQFRQVHIRRMGEKEVYATDQIASFDLPTRAADWLDHGLVKAKSEDVVAIEVKRGKETLSFKRNDTKDKDGNIQTSWMLQGKFVDKTKFDGILRNLADFHLSEVLGNESRPEYGFSAPLARVKLTIKTGETEKTVEKNLIIGKKVDADYLAQIQGSSYIVKVPGFQVQPILETKLKDFITN